jgi:hypothetical protein
LFVDPERLQSKASKPTERTSIAVNFHADQRSLVAIDKEGCRILGINARIDFADGLRLFQQSAQLSLPPGEHPGKPCPELRAACCGDLTQNAKKATSKRRFGQVVMLDRIEIVSEPLQRAAGSVFEKLIAPVEIVTLVSV